MSTPKQPKPTKLLSSAPASAYRTQIVRYPYEDSGRVSYSFQYAADALASTFKGNPEDDSLLLPYLTLYRQAFELRLKHLIATLASYRQTYVEGVTPELTLAQDPEHLRATYGHHLHKLLNEVEKQYTALNLSSPFPPSVRKVIQRSTKTTRREWRSDTRGNSLMSKSTLTSRAFTSSSARTTTR